jgi:hypothetical protein
MLEDPYLPRSPFAESKGIAMSPVYINLTSDSDNDVSTSFWTRRPPSPTLSPTIKQEVAFLAENINAFDDLNEELSGLGENFHQPHLRHLRLPSICGLLDSSALRLYAITQQLLLLFEVLRSLQCCKQIYSGYKILWAVMLVIASILAQGGSNTYGEVREVGRFWWRSPAISVCAFNLSRYHSLSPCTAQPQNPC